VIALRPLAISIAIHLVSTGCAHTEGPDPQHPPPDRGNRVKTVLITIGTALVVGAILVNQAQDNTREAIGDAVSD
jgi:hypothetical protein